MRRTAHHFAHGLGASQHETSADLHMEAKNHHTASSFSSDVLSQVKSMGLRRVAGNVFECPSTKDFWKVEANNKVVRLTSGEVDNGEKLVAADAEDPGHFLNDALNDLTF